MQRALEDGVVSLSATLNDDTGTLRSNPNWGPEALKDLEVLTEMREGVVPAEFGNYAGCCEIDSTLVALNRTATEDNAEVLGDEDLDQLFAGLEFQAIQDESGSESSLVNEIWRLFLLGMAVALVAEAALCLA